MYEAKVLADSISIDPHGGVGTRLITVEVTMPRIVLAEFNTHRLFSRNSASSRAVPVVKQLRRVLEEPFIPEQFGTHKAGMQAGPPLEGHKLELARAQWLRARDHAVRQVLSLLTSPGFADSIDIVIDHLDEIANWLKTDPPPAEWLAVHKQIANRLLEPFMWHTVIVTATEWDNFFALRDHPQAQPEIRLVAQAMRAAMLQSKPQLLWPGEWHLPLVGEEDRRIAREGRAQEPTWNAADWLALVSAGRCARVSFDRHGEYEDPEESRRRAQKLLEYGHMSPLEHPATPAYDPSDWANFRGWKQYRALVPFEANRVGHLEGRGRWDAG